MSEETGLIADLGNRRRRLSGPAPELARYDGRKWAAFTAENGLPSISVTDMAADREGHVWVGTSAGGLSRYDGAQFATLTTRDGLPGS